VVVATVAGPLVGAPAAQAATNTDVALHTLAFAALSVNCTLGSGPGKAVDGASSNIYTDKWCSPSTRPTLTIPLPVTPAGYTVDHIVVKHAGAGGESPALNTRDFRLIVFQPNSGNTYKWVTGNTANVTTTPIGLSGVTQVQLAIDTPTQGTNQVTRIYEVEVWGTPTSPPCTGSGQQVVNPSFQLGQVGWSSSPNVIYNGEASLSSYSNDWLSQTVQLPAACKVVQLMFRVKVDTVEPVPGTHDRLTVQVNSSTVATYWDGDYNAAAYTEAWFDVSAYAGQSVTVRFSVVGDAMQFYTTYFHLYTVQLWAS
jgi:hypothetical protein